MIEETAITLKALTQSTPFDFAQGRRRRLAGRPPVPSLDRLGTLSKRKCVEGQSYTEKDEKDRGGKRIVFTFPHLNG